MDCVCRYDSPLGGITIAGCNDALTGLWFDGQKHFAETLSPDHASGFLPVFDEARRWLDLYFSGKDPGFTPPLELRGTAFRRTVWEILLSVPYGRTTSYGRIAEAIAQQQKTGRISARAVGNAVGHNPVSLILRVSPLPAFLFRSADSRLHRIPASPVSSGRIFPRGPGTHVPRFP